MIEDQKILAVIPARGGSKRVPRKNVLPLAGKPLIAYTIEAALASKYVDRLLVSTDDEEIAEVARGAGAEVPFMRPDELATDSAPDRPVFAHAINWLAEHEDWNADFVLNLRCTTPFKTAQHIDGLIEKWWETSSDSVRSMSRAEGIQHPYWMFKQNERGMAIPMIEGVSIDNYYRRQLLPPVYFLNGVVDGIRADIILDHEKFYGDNMAVYEIPQEFAVDIDTPFDFQLAEFMMQNRPEN
ncbi:MAG: acylneuraminate cytidylyltransferase family protein [Bacteroidota bacterium]